jgi:hypothetical protein
MTRFFQGVAVITSDNQIEILDGSTGLSVGSTRLSGLKGHPYGVGLTGSGIRILYQLNKKFFLARIDSSTFRITDNFEIDSDRG